MSIVTFGLSVTCVHNSREIIDSFPANAEALRGHFSEAVFLRSLKLYMMIAYTELYTFVLSSLTLTCLQGHRRETNNDSCIFLISLVSQLSIWA